MVDWNNPKTLYRAIAQTGLSVAEFARAVQLSRSQLYRLVNGEFHPRFSTQRRIEAVLAAREAA